MKKLIFILMIGTVFSCKKEDCSTPSFTVDQAQLESDIAIIDTYLADNAITAEIHDSGIRYEIIDAGNNNRANDCSRVYVAYTGTLLDGTVFDQTPTGSWSYFSLSNLISGWRIGIPLVGESGEINLYVPSGYAYGESGAGTSIPPNTPLIFNIRVLGVLNEVD